MFYLFVTLLLISFLAAVVSLLFLRGCLYTVILLHFCCVLHRKETEPTVPHPSEEHMLVTWNWYFFTDILEIERERERLLEKWEGLKEFSNLGLT